MAAPPVYQLQSLAGSGKGNHVAATTVGARRHKSAMVPWSAESNAAPHAEVATLSAPAACHQNEHQNRETDEIGDRRNALQKILHNNPLPL